MTLTGKEEVNVKKSELEQKLAALKKMLDNVEGTQTEVYSRIVGYFRSVKNWNAGKRHEYTRRKMYNFPVEHTVKAVSSVNATEQTQNEINDQKTNAEIFSISDTVKEKEIVKYMLFVKPNCPSCLPVKNCLAASSLGATIVDVSTNEGLELAMRYNIQATPTVVFYSKTGLETGRVYTKREVERYLNSLI